MGFTWCLLKILLLLTLSFTLLGFTACSDDNKYDMSSLNNDMDDESDFNEYISDAKNSASNENFSSAYDYLEKARKLGVSSSELSSAKSYVARQKEAYEERIERERQAKLERERQERMAQQSQSSVYVTSWGYDFSGDDRIWGRNGVKLSNGSEFYTWLDRESYGTRCYRVFVQGGLSGNGSNCSDSLNNRWAVSACGSGQFWVDGSYTDVVNAIVGRCGN